MRGRETPEPRLQREGPGGAFSAGACLFAEFLSGETISLPAPGAGSLYPTTSALAGSWDRTA